MKYLTRPISDLDHAGWEVSSLQDNDSDSETLLSNCLVVLPAGNDHPWITSTCTTAPLMRCNAEAAKYEPGFSIRMTYDGECSIRFSIQIGPD